MAYKKDKIDLGLAILSATSRYGQTRTVREIAAYCDVSFQYIQNVERVALAKLRKHISKELLEELMQEVYAKEQEYGEEEI
jgi:hypothetical protein